MRDYEITIILQPEMEDEARNQLLERIQGWIVPPNTEAVDLKIDHWGMREMAYPIKKFRRAYYAYYEANLDPARIREIERNLQFNEQVLRYLVVQKVRS